MSTLEFWPKSFRRSFELAYFIHPEKSVALEIARGALSKLEVAATAQAKRLYYHSPAGYVGAAPKEARFRRKVSLEELPLLQRLVYIESDSYERQEEGASGSRPLSAQDMAVRFVKHLVQITLKRNSFYVTLGVSRVLHNYSTAEAMQIYDAILDDSDRVKDDDYFRSRKAILMQELKARFGERLTSVRGPRGEERFESHPLPNALAPLVRESLNQFVPWDTPCLVPARVAPGRTARLFIAEIEAGDEHRIEVNRMHAILHPDCFAKLTGALRLDSPGHRLEVPRFLLARDSDAGGPGGDRRRPPSVSEEEVAAAAAQAAGEAARRRGLSAGLLRVLVDGTERARIVPAESKTARISVEPGLSLIEVHGRDSRGDVLLAAHLLSHDDRRKTQPQRSAITLEGGQTVSFRCAPETDSAGEMTGLSVEVAYTETSPARAVWLGIRRLLASASASPSRLVVRPAFALLLFAAAGVWIYLQSRSVERPLPPPPSQVAGRSVVRPDVTLPTPALPQPESRILQERLARDLSRNPARAPWRAKSSETEETRGLASQPPAVPLQNVRRVLVECRDERLRDALIRELRASGRLAVAESPESADAVLRVSQAKRVSPNENPRVLIRLIDANGKILWPAARTGSVGRYAGSGEEIAAAGVGELIDAMSARNPSK